MWMWMRAARLRPYLVECVEQSGRSEGKESSKQSLSSHGFPTGLHLRGDKTQRDPTVGHLRRDFI